MKQIAVHKFVRILPLHLCPDQMLAKPGMGFDEGLMIVHNEMQRTLALISHRRNNNARNQLL
jgi:methylaspartate ammonia-lyase